jgi:hypothetical protein
VLISTSENRITHYTFSRAALMPESQGLSVNETNLIFESQAQMKFPVPNYW